MDELIQEAEEQQRQKESVEQEYKKLVQPYKQTEKELHKVRRQRKEAAAEVAAAQKRLQEAREENVRLAGSAESDQARRAVELKKLEDEYGERTRNVDSLKQAVSDSVRAYEEIEPRLATAKGKAQAVAQSLGGAKRTLESLQTDDEFALFG